MRSLAGAVGFSLLLALLTWLLLRGIDTNAPAYAVTLRAFDDYALAEASLHRDVLQARAGLLRDYDSFVSAVRAMQDAVVLLRSHARTEGLDPGPVDRLASAVEQQEALVERFKTSNALLQNSLSYVGLMSTSPAFHAQDTQLASATDALAAAVLYLSRDTSSGALKALQERIDRFSEQAPAGEPDAEVARAMLAHARLLYEELPAVDETLKAFIAVPSRQAVEGARALFFRHRSRVEAVEHRFRLLLYLVSLVLLIILVLLGLRLRARAVALRRRAAFEHVIAENSTRLINCSPAEMEARLKQVLGEFGRAIGADRAYVVLDEKPVRSHLWSADAKPFPSGWPDQALTLSEPLVEVEADDVTVPDVAALPPGPLKDALTLAGVRAWACVPLTRPGRVRSMMGFDAFGPVRERRRFRCQSSGLPETRSPMPSNANSLSVTGRNLRCDWNGRVACKWSDCWPAALRITSTTSSRPFSAIRKWSSRRWCAEPSRRAMSRRYAARRSAGAIWSTTSLPSGGGPIARVRPVQVRSLLEEAASLLRVSLPSDVELVLEDVSD